MSLIPNLAAGSPVLKLVERAVTALERIAFAVECLAEDKGYRIPGERTEASR